MRDSLFTQLPRRMLEGFDEILNAVEFFRVGIFSSKPQSVVGHFKISADLSLGFSLLQFPACKID